MAHKIRIAEFDSILQAEKINLSKLQELCFTGIPDEGGRRALCWQLLLHYLPVDRKSWPEHLSAKRKQYHAFVDDIIVAVSSLSQSASSEALHNSNNSSDISSLGSNSLDESTSSADCREPPNGSRTNSNAPPTKTDAPPTNSNAPPSNFNAPPSNSNAPPTNFNAPPTKTDVPPSSLPTHRRTLSNTSLQTGSGSCSDHPLNLNPDSQWGSYFKDNEILAQIDKDVRRLCPDMCFFQRVTAHPRPHTPRLSSRVTYTPLHSAPLSSKLSYNQRERSTRRRASSPAPEPLPAGSETHWEVLERVLFIYAKLNPGQSYVQGMNEIIGPLYYVLASVPSEAAHAEADTFWLFTSLMADVRDLFIRTLDDSESGITRLMTRLMSCLQDQDSATAGRLEEQGVKEQYFAFRWLSLMFSQEFPLPDVIRVWDSVLASPDRHRCLLLLATAMIVLQRDKILANDFASNVKLLQNYPPCDVGTIISKALQLSGNLMT